MSYVADPIIEVRDLVVRYGDRTVLDGVNFTVNRGETFVILGGSGCGKSTLLRNLVGLMRPYSGSIRINGQDITTMSDQERVEVRKKLGMCFQASALFNSMTGGTAGVGYLRKMLDVVLFPELWRVRTAM